MLRGHSAAQSAPRDGRLRTLMVLLGRAAARSPVGAVPSARVLPPTRPRRPRRPPSAAPTRDRFIAAAARPQGADRRTGPDRSDPSAGPEQPLAPASL